jgi:hypothetical protein
MKEVHQYTCVCVAGSLYLLQALPYDLQCQLCSLEAEHSFEHGFKESLAQPGGRERLKQALIDNPPVVHPVSTVVQTSTRTFVYHQLTRVVFPSCLSIRRHCMPTSTTIAASIYLIVFRARSHAF